MKTLEAFVELWLGPRRESYGVPEDEMKGLDLPDILKRFYRFMGRWPGEPLRHQNYLIDPKDMTAEKRKKNLGLIEFATENQGVYRWATVADGSEDPAIYATEHWEPYEPHTDWDYSSEPYPGWNNWDFKLTNFLVEFVLTELLARSLASMPPEFISYVNSSICSLDVLSRQPITDKPRFALVDKQWLVFDSNGQGWESVAVRDEAAKKALAGFSPAESDVIKLSVIFGPTIPVESYAHKPWSITVEPDGSAIIHPGIRYFNVGKFKSGTFDFDGILSHVTPASRERLGPGVSFKKGSENKSGSLSAPFMKTLYLDLIKAIEGLDTRFGYPDVDLLKAHPPEFTGLGPVVSESLKQKYRHFEFYKEF